MRVMRVNDDPFIVTGRSIWSPFYGRDLFSSWRFNDARAVAMRIIMTDDRIRSVRVARGDEVIMTIRRRDHRFGRTYQVVFS